MTSNRAKVREKWRFTAEMAVRRSPARAWFDRLTTFRGNGLRSADVGSAHGESGGLPLSNPPLSATFLTIFPEFFSRSAPLATRNVALPAQSGGRRQKRQVATPPIRKNRNPKSQIRKAKSRARAANRDGVATLRVSSFVFVHSLPLQAWFFAGSRNRRKSVLEARGAITAVRRA